LQKTGIAGKGMESGNDFVIASFCVCAFDMWRLVCTACLDCGPAYWSWHKVKGNPKV
jgi:hypothetical protein